MSNHAPLGWDYDGRRAGPVLDDATSLMIERLQQATDRGTATHVPQHYRDPVAEQYGHPTIQIRTGLLIFTNGLILRRGGRSGRTWSPVALIGDGLLTIGDVALVLGLAKTTLNGWIDEGKPLGNPFPEPTMLTSLSSTKPIRLWSRWDVLDWHHRRAGRGYRSDRSALRPA